MKRSHWVVILVIASIASIGACDGGATTSPVESVAAGPQSADARLDQADANTEKAIALLMAAVNEGARKPDRAFGGHREKAISLLEKARGEIAAARDYADDPMNTP